jgi:uncharacterized protein involved in outer membrane biogenesis
MARNGRRTGLIITGVVVLVLVAVVLLWDWNWFKPILEARASAALGRPVAIGRLHVGLGRTTQVTLDDVQVDNPAGFPADGKFATIAHLTVRIGLFDYLFHHHLLLPLIDVEQPVVNAQQLASGQSNWALGGGKSGGSGPTPDIGDLRIVDGQARVRIPKLRADFKLAVATQPPGAPAQSTGGGSTDAANPDNRIIVSADGTYAAQKITGKFVGGALLSLRDASKPYPIDLQLQNGGTTVSLVGTVQNPLKFAGADLKLRLAGQDMAALYPLTGVAIPSTPPYHLTGNLDYAAHRIRFRDFEGVVGKSDLGGTIAVDPRPDGPRPLVVADLHSRSVDLNDLAGFIGGTPGEKSTPGQTPAQQAQVARAAASDRLLPTKPISIPRLLAADVSLRYKGDHIQGRYVPLDNIVVALDITNGDIRLHPLDFAIGSGTMASEISLREHDKVLYTKANVDFRQIDLARIMQATHAFKGAGTIGGGATLDTTGNSLSAMLSNGNGSLRLNMAGGGNLSALLQDLSGLEFGNALLSALGIPNKAQIRCLRSDFTLTDGMLKTNVFALDTTEAVTRGSGTIDFHDEKVDYKIQTKPVSFSIGTLRAPIDITGTLKKPSIGPNAKALAIRGGAAAGLGILFPPLALLPTIQFGVGNNTDCERLAGGNS